MTAAAPARPAVASRSTPDREVKATILRASRNPEKHGITPDNEDRDLVSIHRIRDHVEARHPGTTTDQFNRAFRQSRSNGSIRAIAISDYRDMTQRQLDRSVPGMNETIAYVIVGRSDRKGWR